MRKIFCIISFLISSSITLFAQDTARVVDRVNMNDHSSRLGQVTADKKGDFLLMNINGKASDTISYINVASVEYRIDNPMYDTVMKIDTFTSHYVTNNTAPIRCFYSIHQTRRRNIGIGFTVAGVGLLGVGVALIALTPRTPNTSFLSSITPGTVAGMLMSLGGIGMTIPGALILGKCGHKHRKANN